MPPPRRTKKAGSANAAREPAAGVLSQFRALSSAERLTFFAAIALTLWSLIQVVAHYPEEFFPRFADEGVYAAEATIPASIFSDLTKEELRYAPAKLGYGIPLALSSWALGKNGPMYLSTLFWLTTIVAVWALARHWFGLLAASIAVGYLSWSAIFGKYVTDVGPTAEASLVFALFWGASCTRRAWLVGLAVGAIAFIDFKWAVPAALAIVCIELFLEQKSRWIQHLMRIATAGAISLGLLGAAMLIHRTYASALLAYVFPHSGLMDFSPSPIAFYYLFVFGSLAGVAVGLIAFVLKPSRDSIIASERRLRFPALRALVIMAAPVLFYSLFGELKALRFFAVTFPLIAVLVGFSLSTLASVSDELIPRVGGSRFARTILPAATAFALVAVIHGGSSGPGHHLTLPTGYPEALDRLRAQRAEGTISSYNYPTVAYGWPAPFPAAPFAYVGLQPTDKWIALDPALDRAIVELRIRMGAGTENPDSVWAFQANVYRAISDSVFSVPSDFNASDYFLSENLVGGIDVLREWQSRRLGEDFLTMRRINSDKLHLWPKAPN